MSNNKKYSLIVIGSGMTGLSSALTWAKNNNLKEKPVLLIEKNDKTGGYVTTYNRKGYNFDTCQIISNLNNIYQYFGVDINLKQFTGYYMRVFLIDPKTKAVKIINLPSGKDNFTKHLMKEYSDEAENIEKFMKYSDEMYNELFKLKYDPGFFDIMKMLFTTPKVISNASKSFGEYVDKFGIKNPELREIFKVFAALSGLPEYEVAALLPIGVLFSLLDGAYRPKDGFIELPKALEKRYTELGGDLMLNTAVEEIIVENSEVKGVKLENGDIINSDYVITTVETKIGMEKLVGLDILKDADPKYAGKVENVEMSLSSMNIALGLDDNIDLAGLGLDCGYNMMTSGGESFEKLYEGAKRGKILFSEELFHIGVICPSLTTGGKPNITIRVVPMSIGNWAKLKKNDREKYKAEKEKWSNFFIELVEKYMIPDLRKHIVIKDVASPATYAFYSGSPTASIYDMESRTNNFGRSRLSTKTPIKGLYQPKFAHGVFGTINGGMQAIDMIMDQKIMGGNSRIKL